MRLGELGNIGHTLANSPVGGDRIWQREAGQVSEQDIQLFYARSGLAGSYQAAIDAIERLQAACIRLAFDGIAEDLSAIILHTPPPPPFAVDELVDGLVQLNEPRRNACLFALEAKLDPNVVVGLRWAAVDYSAFSGLALDILYSAASMRHIRLPYVFWEWATNKIATPLLDLTSSIEGVFGCTWPQLVQRYSRIIQVDSRAEQASFLQLVQEVRTGRK